MYLFFAYISRADGSEKHQLGPCSMPWNAIERIQQKKVSCKFSWNLQQFFWNEHPSSTILFLFPMGHIVITSPLRTQQSRPIRRFLGPWSGLQPQNDHGKIGELIGYTMGSWPTDGELWHLAPGSKSSIQKIRTQHLRSSIQPEFQCLILNHMALSQNERYHQNCKIDLHGENDGPKSKT